MSENLGLFWLAAGMGVLSLGRGQNLLSVVSCQLSVAGRERGDEPRGSCGYLFRWLLGVLFQSWWPFSTQ